MIIDSHCHAWDYWPYEPPVPDAESRGRIEQLLHEMDKNGVDKAVIICAQIDHNPANNAYIAGEAARYPDRIYQFADVDCSWSPTYHQPGAANRLRGIADRWPIKGFTHYLRADDDGAWLYADEGLAFFEVATQQKLIASIAGHPGHQPAIRELARHFPQMPILLHHLGGVKADETPANEGLNQVLESASLPNIYVKLSGFAYASSVDWDFPYPDTHRVIQAQYERYGRRMCWGSDYPVVRNYMTHQHALEAFRTHCTFVTDDDRDWILGLTLEQLLNAARAV